MENLLRSLQSYLTGMKQEGIFFPDPLTGYINVDIVPLKEHLDNDPLVHNGINRLIHAGYLKLTEQDGEASAWQVVDVSEALHEIQLLTVPYLKL